MPKEIDHTLTDEVVCPWCGHEHSDSWEFDNGEHECEECEKPFIVSVNQSVTYDTTKVEE